MNCFRQIHVSQLNKISFFDMWLPNNILKTRICQKAAVILYKYLDSALSASTSSFLPLFLSSDYGFNKLSSVFQEIPLLLHSYQLLPLWQPAPCLKSCLRFILAFPLPSNLNAVFQEKYLRLAGEILKM